MLIGARLDNELRTLRSQFDEKERAGISGRCTWVRRCFEELKWANGAARDDITPASWVQAMRRGLSQREILEQPGAPYLALAGLTGGSQPSTRLGREVSPCFRRRNSCPRMAVHRIVSSLIPVLARLTGDHVGTIGAACRHAHSFIVSVAVFLSSFTSGLVASASCN